MAYAKMALLAVVALAVAAGFWSGDYLTLENLSQARAHLLGLVDRHPLLAPLGYWLLYVLASALSIPVAGALTLLGGALFGLVQGVALASVASVTGASLAFLLARWVFADSLKSRYAKQLRAFDEGVRREGAYYLFAARMIPVFPFFVVNLVAAMTPLTLVQFAVASFCGMLPLTAAYVFAGTHLGGIESVGDVVAPGLIASIALLGLAPLALRFAMRWYGQRRRLRKWRKPRVREANLVVIGGGAAGLVAALIAAALKAKVILIERAAMGGDCLNTGCVPSKVLLDRVGALARGRGAGGKVSEELAAHYPRIRAEITAAIEVIGVRDSPERFAGLGVECVSGEAKLLSPWTVAVGSRHIHANKVIVASGASPALPQLPGLDEVDYLTSESVWNLEQVPGRMVVVGGGAVACELGQAFAKLGSEVTLAVRGELLSGEDRDAVAWLRAGFAAEGMQILEQCAFERVRGGEGGGGALLCSAGELPFDALLIAVGRQPCGDVPGLREIGVQLGEAGEIRVDRFLRTSAPTVYACGDVIGGPQFTHAASREAWHATANALFGFAKRTPIDYAALPRALFTDPQLARVGLNECEAVRSGIAYEVTRFPLADVDSVSVAARSDGEVKLLTRAGSDRLIGVTVTGHNASAILAPYVVAMGAKMGLKRLGRLWFPYPTHMEAAAAAANQWVREHAPERVLRWLEAWHGMTRGAKRSTG